MTADDQVFVTVDREVCVGVGQCELLEPAVFHLDDDDGVSRVIDGATLTRARAEKVIEACPSNAISIVGGA